MATFNANPTEDDWIVPSVSAYVPQTAWLVSPALVCVPAELKLTRLCLLSLSSATRPCASLDLLISRSLTADPTRWLHFL